MCLQPGDKARQGTMHWHPQMRWGDPLLCTGPKTGLAFWVLLCTVPEWMKQKK